MKIKISISVWIILCLTSAIYSTLSVASPLSSSTFDTCSFDAKETSNFALDRNTKWSPDSYDHGYCAIYYKYAEPNSLGKNFSITIESPTHAQLTRKGFVKSPDGSWHFQGSSLDGQDHKYSALGIDQRKLNSDVVLIGHQIEARENSKAAVISVPGLRIVRVTPDFVVSATLDFDPSIPKDFAANVETQLLEIANSVTPKGH